MNLTMLTAMAIGVLALLARRSGGSWIAPAALFAAFWAAILFVAGFAFPNVDPLASAALYILCANVAVWVGSLVGRGFDPPPGRPSPLGPLPGLRTLIILANVIGIVEVISLFWRQGYHGLNMFSLMALIQVTVVNRSALYHGAQQSHLEWVVFLVLYASTLLGGVLFRLRTNWRDVVLAISAPIVLWIVFMLYGSRMGVLYGGANWIGAYLATSAFVARDPRIFSPRTLARTAVLGAILLLGLSLVTQGIRYGKDANLNWRNVFADGFSYPAAMGIWMDRRGPIGDDFTAGARTFGRVVDKVGITAEPLPAIPVGFTSSNIYTIFRDIIEDFGTFGSLIFFLAVGWVGQVSFARARAGRRMALIWLTAVYAFLLTSPTDGIFAYTISIAALVLFAAYVLVATSRAGGLVPSGAAALPLEGK
jgi:oligosaccharide repeat unit polymerase